MHKIIKFIDSVPSWLRWILFLPIALIVSSITAFLSFVINSYLPYLPPTAVYLFSNFISVFVFMSVSYLIVPKYQFIVSLILTILITILAAIDGFLISAGFGNIIYSLWIEILGRIVMIASAAFFTIAMHTEEEKEDTFKT